MKYALKRITEPDQGKVHYASVGIQDAVTLCYMTDFIGQTEGVETRKSVNCRDCINIVKAIQAARKEQL